MSIIHDAAIIFFKERRQVLLNNTKCELRTCSLTASTHAHDYGKLLKIIL